MEGYKEGKSIEWRIFRGGGVTDCGRTEMKN